MNELVDLWMLLSGGIIGYAARTREAPTNQIIVGLAVAAAVVALPASMVAQPGMAQPGGELAVGSLGGFAVEQQGEPLGVAEAVGALVVLQFAEGAGHAGQAELDELIDGGMGEQGLSPQW